MLITQSEKFVHQTKDEIPFQCMSYCDIDWEFIYAVHHALFSTMLKFLNTTAVLY